MRWWLVIVLLGSAGAARAAPVGHVPVPIASHFDLTRFMVQPVAEQTDRIDDSRWLTADIAPPPGPPRDPPMVRIRGKKVKFRMSF